MKNGPINTGQSLGFASAIRNWAIGMPWVNENHAARAEGMMIYVIDCPELSRHAPWFAVEAIRAGGCSFEAGIYAILPDSLAARAVSTGCATGIEALGSGHSIASVPTPTSDQEFRALQRLLEHTYVTAFQ